MDLNESTFQDDVLEFSKTQPVLVDFWAPWCGPCRVLGPILESLSAEYEGRVRMVKINADHAPKLSQQYQIRSIPMVLLFKDGKVTDQFLGLRQAAEIRRLIDAQLPRIEDADLALAIEFAEAHRFDDAIDAYKRVLALNPAQEQARLAYVQVLLRASMWQEALQAFEVLRSKARIDPKIGSVEVLIQAATGLAQSVGSASLAASNSIDSLDDASVPQRTLRRAQQAMLSACWAEAMNLFLEVLATDRKTEGERVRKSMLAIFQICPDQELVGQYRRKLSALLH